MPYMLSSRGYGLYLNTTYRSEWRLDSEGLRKDLALPADISAFDFQVRGVRERHANLNSRVSLSPKLIHIQPPTPTPTSYLLH